jgi:hypothetical protein
MTSPPPSRQHFREKIARCPFYLKSVHQSLPPQLLEGSYAPGNYDKNLNFQCFLLLDHHMKALTLLLIEMLHKQLSLGMSMMSSLVMLKTITHNKPWVK